MKAYSLQLNWPDDGYAVEELHLNREVALKAAVNACKMFLPNWKDDYDLLEHWDGTYECVGFFRIVPHELVFEDWSSSVLEALELLAINLNHI